MESLGAIMMVIALMWPIAGGALTGLIGGIVRGHGLLGTILDMVICGAAGFGLAILFFRLSDGLPLPDSAGPILSIGLPVVGALLALGVRSKLLPA